eukprot:CAMPEP_0204032318 /NCGR_PEP_ID=MMETSP0360-20130528/65977_1 /ASSEMBLY_ACC=CAM_ASM_000342 /TAXON_ID=268821 /ORGANISM="Scrippsiella Hangoei, Strain SHTV-5" /LENGTH=47 /DNA_ID= /DNA_START= /DNA_END= /DNA_ORIENTATION=
MSAAATRDLEAGGAAQEKAVADCKQEAAQLAFKSGDTELSRKIHDPA